jgi:hypothetical protein
MGRVVVNFAFFEDLTPDEAESLLQSFLADARDAMPEFLDSATNAGLTPDFTLSSIPPLLDWIRESVNTVGLAPDPELPDWIRSSETYKKSLFAFDAPSGVTIVRGAYYLGESFTRSLDHLRWAVGREGTAPQGQPVVTGFRYEMEMPVLLVAENTIARGLREPSERSATTTAVESWSAKA